MSAVRAVSFKNYDVLVRDAPLEVTWTEGEVLTNIPETMKDAATVRAFGELLLAMADEMEGV